MGRGTNVTMVGLRRPGPGRPLGLGSARGRVTAGAALGALAVLIGLGACALPSTGTGAPLPGDSATATDTAAATDSATATAAAGAGGAGTSAAPVPVGAAGSALKALATLKVRGLAPKTGYTREKFGQAWADVDHNSCDTRDDVLNRDLARRTWRTTGDGRCVVTAGVLKDPYTARTITFTKTDAAKVQIDHVVALGDAWQTGASAWTTARRTQLANDPGNLLAVDGQENESKGDDDASEWLPPNKAFDCSYVARQIGIKAKYGLWVTPAEHDAMRAVLSSCPAQPALAS